MTHLQKLRFYTILKWVSSSLSHGDLRLSKDLKMGNIYPFYSLQNHSKFYSGKALKVDENEQIQGTLTSNGENARKISGTVKREAQGALLDYLHSTRSLQFLDAEHMSKNSPHFLRKLIENVGDESNIGHSMTRFLRYHPVNEFEPFLESIGLGPSDFVPLLPRDLMFLSDEKGLLDNYHVLCEYGIARKKIGNIFSEAREVFRYDHGILRAKLQSFEELGISQSVIAKAVTSSPYILIGDIGREFFKVVGKLKCLGYEYDWVEGCLLENTTYNWRQVFELLCILSDLGCNAEEIGNLIGRHPELLFDDSGGRTFSLIGFLLKFGCTKNDICSMFSQFPQIKVGTFVWNLRRVSQLLTEIEMDSSNVGRIIRPHFAVLGSCSMKKANSILANLNTGKKRLCQIIIENPLEMKNWVRGKRVEPLPEEGRSESSHMEKIKFLTSMGFVEHSREMEKALKAFRGKGEELQERFDCLVNAGLNPTDVSRMIKVAPQILNQSQELIETKIRLLVNDLGYPVSSLRTFPAYLSYTMERVKLRYSMYNWLIDQKVVHPQLSLSTIIPCTESYFMKRYVNKHPNGPKMWQELNKTISSV